jgi:predicted TIM-barrel fold metal-dependent hydrolase
VEKIIDMHSHIGDILYPDGGKLIFKKGVRMKYVIDPFQIYERRLWRMLGLLDTLIFSMESLMVRADQEKNWSGTLENMRTTMDEAGIWKTVCMPIPPHVTFDDLHAAQQQDEGVIPFTGFDPRAEYDVEAALRRDVERGAKGMKLHPIIQNEALTSRRTYEAVEAFAPYELPILFHSGVATYYLKKESYRQNPEHGNIHYGRDLVEDFPQVTFIFGHSGLREVTDVLRWIPKHPNAYVEISFMNPENIRELVGAFGPERVLFGSDWPWAKRTTAVKAIEEALAGEKALQSMICYENAARILKMGD